MKRIQNFYLYSYRLVGFIFLSGLIASILWYGFSILFFIGNSSWSVPMILSPNQEKVMAHLEHVLAFEHEITKNKSEMIATTQALNHKNKLLVINQSLLEHINQSMSYQSLQYDKTSQDFKNLSQEKITNVKELNKLTSKMKKHELIIDKELKSGLITKQEALLAHINWNKLLSNVIDSKVSIHDLEKRSLDYADAASTLNGSGNNLKLIDKVIKKVELEGQIAQLKSDIFSLNLTVKHLNKNIKKKTRVLASMTNSPYILATKKATTVAFVPYSNLKKVTVGEPVFSCFMDMILCYKSGYVLSIYNAEEYAKHPVFKSDIKGQLIGIAFNQETDGQKKLLFLKSKPLLI